MVDELGRQAHVRRRRHRREPLLDLGRQPQAADELDELGLTEAGNVYYEHCQRIARELEQAQSAVSQLQSGPRGWLRFTVPYSIGITWIAPLLGSVSRVDAQGTITTIAPLFLSYCAMLATPAATSGPTSRPPSSRCAVSAVARRSRCAWTG